MGGGVSFVVVSILWGFYFVDFLSVRLVVWFVELFKDGWWIGRYYDLKWVNGRSFLYVVGDDMCIDVYFLCWSKMSIDFLDLMKILFIVLSL